MESREEFHAGAQQKEFPQQPACLSGEGPLSQGLGEQPPHLRVSYYTHPRDTSLKSTCSLGA